MSSQFVSNTIGSPNNSSLPFNRIVSTQCSYSSSFMNPRSGENPPALSSSTSHAFRSDSSSARVHDAIALAFAPSSSSIRFTSAPPCGAISPSLARDANVRARVASAARAVAVADARVAVGEP